MYSTYRMRRATRDDARDLARLRAASLAELGLLTCSSTFAFERNAEAEIDALFGRTMLDAWLLVAGDCVAGSASILYWRRLPYPRASLHAELAGVYVTPSHRGRGIASALCREAVKTAQARGVRTIVVHPSHVGRRLYENLGFVENGAMRLACKG